MNLLIIDNYDSFTYNLAQAFGSIGVKVQVCRNDQISVAEVQTMQPDRIVISPGPGTPDDGGISLDVLAQVSSNIPTLGVCLGHQCIGQAFGGLIIRAGNLMHGKTSEILHDGHPIFTDVPNPFIATRYHSLIVENEIPDSLEVIARTAEGEIMGLRHRELPIIGVQFHPESILTEYGPQIMKNFVEGHI
jgi:anthranilate synthase/aminodeoxychorismate synthase-like glutamine amidotransferase